MTTKLLALTLALLPALAGARVLGPGTLEVGGGTSLDFGTVTREVNGVEQFDISTLSLDADALWYLVNNFGLGVGISYERTELDDGVDSDEFSQTIVGPEAKFNLPIAPMASLVAEGLVGRIVVDDNGDDADGFAWQVGGGVRFFPADYLSLDALLRYTSASVEDDAGTELDEAGWNVGVGLSFYFGGR